MSVLKTHRMLQSRPVEKKICTHQEIAACQQALELLTTLSPSPIPTESGCWRLPLPKVGANALSSVKEALGILPIPQEDAVGYAVLGKPGSLDHCGDNAALRQEDGTSQGAGWNAGLLPRMEGLASVPT